MRQYCNRQIDLYDPYLQHFIPSAVPVAGPRREKPLPRLLGAAVARAAPLSWALMALGTLGMLCLPLASKKIFFDENSLNIGSSNAYIKCGATHHYRQPVSAKSGPNSLIGLPEVLSNDMS